MRSVLSTKLTDVNYNAVSTEDADRVNGLPTTKPLRVTKQPLTYIKANRGREGGPHSPIPPLG